MSQQDSGEVVRRAIRVEYGGRAMIGGWADDGYEFAHNGEQEGWVPVYAWGIEGWDLGDPPYVVYLFGDLIVDGGRVEYQRACYCEGDVTVETYATAEDRSDDTDEAALFYWKNHDEPWAREVAKDTPADEMPAHLRGAFSWKRLDEEPVRDYRMTTKGEG